MEEADLILSSPPPDSPTSNPALSQSIIDDDSELPDHITDTILHVEQEQKHRKQQLEAAAAAVSQHLPCATSHYGAHPPTTPDLMTVAGCPDPYSGGYHGPPPEYPGANTPTGPLPLSNSYPSYHKALGPPSWPPNGGYTHGPDPHRMGGLPPSSTLLDANPSHPLGGRLPSMSWMAAGDSGYQNGYLSPAAGGPGPYMYNCMPSPPPPQYSQHQRAVPTIVSAAAYHSHAGVMYNGQSPYGMGYPGAQGPPVPRPPPRLDRPLQQVP